MKKVPSRMKTEAAFVFTLLVIFNCISHHEVIPADKDSPTPSKRYFKYEAQHKKDLIDIFSKMDPLRPCQLERVKEEWDRLYPNSNVSKEALYHRYRKLSKNLIGNDVSEKRGNIKWTEKYNKELVNLYYDTFPGHSGQSERMNKQWKIKYPKFPVRSRTYLLERVNWLLQKHPEYERKEPMTTTFNWTGSYDSDLLHIFHNIPRTEHDRLKKIHELWSHLFPDHSDIPLSQLIYRAEYLNRREPPNQYFPWTPEMDAELLQIFFVTSPEIEDQGNRIHEIWSKRHPRYAFMTPLYLQAHASTLAKRWAIEHGESSKVKWTEKERANLIEIYHRHDGDKHQKDKTYAEWVRLYPKYAYIPDRFLIAYAQRWTDEVNIDRRRFKKRFKYTSEHDAELLDIFQKTHPHERGHANRMYKKWEEKYGNETGISPFQLRQHAIKLLNKEDSKVKYMNTSVLESSDGSHPSKTGENAVEDDDQDWNYG